MGVKICVPLTGRDRTSLMQQAEKICRDRHYQDIDVVEFRYDLASMLPKEELLETLKALKTLLSRPKLLFTIRTKEQGGEFSGDYSAYEAVNCAVIESGSIDMVDVELRREGYSNGRATERDMKSAERILREAKAQGIKSIASYHDFSGTPESYVIRDLFWELADCGADVVKLAFMPKNEEDVLRLMLETRSFRTEDEEQHEYITMSMGALGAISRVAGAVSGSDYTFMTIGEASAPGQLSVETGLTMMQNLAKAEA